MAAEGGRGHGAYTTRLSADGGEVLLKYRVVISDQLKGNRAAIFAQSRQGKANTVKVVLFWLVFNNTYGKLVFDYKGEYVPDRE